MSSCGYGCNGPACNQCGKFGDLAKKDFFSRRCPGCGCTPPDDAIRCPECGRVLPPVFVTPGEVVKPFGK